MKTILRLSIVLSAVLFFNSARAQEGTVSLPAGTYMMNEKTGEIYVVEDDSKTYDFNAKSNHVDYVYIDSVRYDQRSGGIHYGISGGYAFNGGVTGAISFGGTYDFKRPTKGVDKDGFKLLDPMRTGPKFGLRYGLEIGYGEKEYEFSTFNSLSMTAYIGVDLFKFSDKPALVNKAGQSWKDKKQNKFNLFLGVGYGYEFVSDVNPYKLATQEEAEEAGAWIKKNTQRYTVKAELTYEIAKIKSGNSVTGVRLFGGADYNITSYSESVSRFEGNVTAFAGIRFCNR